MTALPPPPEVALKPAKGPSTALIVGLVLLGFSMLCCGCGGFVTLLGVVQADQALDQNFEEIQRQLEEEQRRQPQDEEPPPPEDDWEE